MKRTTYLALIALAVSYCVAPAASAAEFGTIKGRFVFKGKAPTMKKLVVTKDKQVCGDQVPHDERLVVSKGGGIRDVVIYALGDPKNIKDIQTPVSPIHPSYDKTKNAEVIFDNKLLRFGPHLLKLRTTQKLILKNSDPVGHNSFGSPFNNKAFNPLIPANSQVTVDLPLAEKTPVTITCSIHGWMKGYVVVRPDPYVAISKADGSFTIANIPTGTRSYQLWNDGLGYLSKVTIGGKKSLEKRGRHKLTVKPGVNDLGDIVINAKDYGRKLKRLR